MKLKKLFFLFACTAPLVIWVRVFQLTQMIDPETGFYLDNYDKAGLWIAVGIAFLAAIFLILGRLVPQIPKRPPRDAKAVGAASALMAFAMIFELFDALSGSPAPSVSPAASGPAGTLFGDAAYVLLILFSIVFFVLYAAYQFTGKRRAMLLCTAPILWSALRLGKTFMYYTGLADISENRYDIVMLCLMLIFWLLHGRVAGGFEYKKAVRRFPGIGFAAALMILAGTLPRLYVLWFAPEVRLHDSTLPKPVNLATAVYICVFLYAFYTPRKKSASREAVEAAEFPEISGIPESESAESANEVTGRLPNPAEPAPAPIEYDAESENEQNL